MQMKSIATSSFVLSLALAPAALFASPITVRGVVFDDRNNDGIRQANEPGLPGVGISDQHAVVSTAADGTYELATDSDATFVVVTTPDGWRPRGLFWRPLASDANQPPIDFALTRGSASRSFTFIHASDTHLSEASLPRIRRLREMVAAAHPDFVLITGDLVKDALRVTEPVARGYYEMLIAELAQFPVPVFTVPGNHENFGIERHLSLVSKDNPLYGRKMYRHYLGPEYYSFDWGGVHFVGVDSVDIDDLWYYGHVDTAQMEWLGHDLARVPAATPVVTFNHIPFATAIDVLGGYTEEPPAPTLIRIDGHMQYRHVVSNTADVLEKIAPHRLEIALAGHMHAREMLAIETTVGRVRFYQTAAVVGPSEAPGLNFVSGITLYRVKDGHVDEGTFMPLDETPAKP